jgi:hypothetical protein
MIYMGLVQDDFAFTFAMGKVPKWVPDSTPYFENALALRLIPYTFKPVLDKYNRLIAS